MKKCLFYSRTHHGGRSQIDKISGSSGPGCIDPEALHGRILKFGEDIKILRTRLKNFIDWLANKSPPWAAYREFMSGRLIALDKKPGVHPVGVRKNWRRLFSNIGPKVTGPEATTAFQDGQLCAWLKVVIYAHYTGFNLFGTKSQPQSIGYFCL